MVFKFNYMHPIPDFIPPIVYIRIHPEELSVRNVRTGDTIIAPPLLAISGGIVVHGSVLQGGTTVSGTNPKVVAIGEEAFRLKDEKNIKIVNPFSHPRTPLSDFCAAEYIISKFIHKLFSKKTIFFSPIIIIHLAVELDGDITQIEAQALVKLASKAGCNRCYGWLGPDLSNEQIMKWQFPKNGKIIDPAGVNIF